MSDFNFYVQRNTIARLEEQLTKNNQTLERTENTDAGLFMPYEEHPLHDNENDAPFATYDDDFHQPGKAGDADLAATVETHFQNGVALCQAGKMDEAVREWRQVLAIQPDNAFALINIGIVLTEQASWSEAREMFSRALRVQPESAEAHYGLGMAEAQLGNYAGAVIAWEQTLRLQPNNADAQYNLALVREKAAQRNAEQTAPSAESKIARESRRKMRQESPTPAPAAVPEAANSQPEPKTSLVAQESAALVQPITVAPAEQSVPIQEAPYRPVDTPRSPKARSIPWGGALLAVGAVCAGLLYMNHLQSPPKPVAGSTNPPKLASVASTQTTDPSAAVNPSKTGSEALPAPPIPDSSPAIILAAADHRASDVARAGRMQIRLANGLSGRFRYWFFSDANPTVHMRTLPGADNRGIISIPIPAEYNFPGAQLRLLNVSQGKVAKLPAIDVSRNTTLVSPNVGPNLLKNADFTQGQKDWSFEMSSGGRGALTFKDGLATPSGVRGRVAHFEVSAIGRQKWNVQCLQRGLAFEEGKPYLLSFWARANKNRTLSVDAILDKPDWHQVARFPNVNLSTQWQKFLMPFKVVRAQPAHTQVSFLMGDSTGSWEMSGLSVRAHSGGDTFAVVKPGNTVTVSAGDFN